MKKNFNNKKEVLPKQRILNPQIQSINPLSEQDLIDRFEIMNIDNHFYKNTQEMHNYVPQLLFIKFKIDSFKIRIGKRVVEFKKDVEIGINYKFYYSLFELVKQQNLNPYDVIEISNDSVNDIYKKYKGEDLTDKKILIASTAFGDTIMTQSIVRYLKYKYPTCKIYYNVPVEYKYLLDCYPNGLIDVLIKDNTYMERKWLDECDYHIFTNFFIDRNNESKTKNAFDILKELFGCDDMEINNFIPILEPKKFILKEIKKYIKDPYIIFQLRSSTINRSISYDKAIELLTKIGNKTNCNLIILDDNNMSDYYNKNIISKLPENIKKRTFNLCKLSENMHYPIAFISNAEYVVAIDSVFNHIAGATNTKNIGLFTCFKGELRLKYYPNSKWVEPEESACSKWPCFYHYHQLNNGECPYITNTQNLNDNDFPICSTEVNIDKIIDLINI